MRGHREITLSIIITIMTGSEGPTQLRLGMKMLRFGARHQNQFSPGSQTTGIRVPRGVQDIYILSTYLLYYPLMEESYKVYTSYDTNRLQAYIWLSSLLSRNSVGVSFPVIKAVYRNLSRSCILQVSSGFFKVQVSITQLLSL